MSFIPNLIYRFNTVLTKTPSKLFCGYQQSNLKVFIWKGEVVSTILRRLKLEDIYYLTSRLTISRQHDIGKRNANRSVEQNRKARNRHMQI